MKPVHCTVDDTTKWIIVGSSLGGLFLLFCIACTVGCRYSHGKKRHTKDQTATEAQTLITDIASIQDPSVVMPEATQVSSDVIPEAMEVTEDQVETGECVFQTNGSLLNKGTT